MRWSTQTVSARIFLQQCAARWCNPPKTHIQHRKDEHGVRKLLSGLNWSNMEPSKAPDPANPDTSERSEARLCPLCEALHPKLAWSRAFLGSICPAGQQDNATQCCTRPCRSQRIFCPVATGRRQKVCTTTVLCVAWCGPSSEGNEVLRSAEISS